MPFQYVHCDRGPDSTFMLTAKVIIGGALAAGALAIVVAPRVNLNWRSAPASPAAFSTNTLGYLSPKELPDVRALIQPPPAQGSSRMAADEKAREAALLLRGTPRYVIAVADAVRSQPNTAADFQCAVGTRISEQATPRLFELLSRVRIDVRAATYPAKAYFARQHPFVVHQAPTCAPEDAAILRNEGAYPSARAAVGWAYAAVLSDLMPQRAAILRNRAEQFAQSRVVCGEEWQSDVDAGPIIASATVARERTKEAFRADLEAARREVDLSLGHGSASTMDCKNGLPTVAMR